MASAVDEGPPPKKMAVVDAAASKKRTIDNLPNELLEVIVRSVPQGYDRLPRNYKEAFNGPNDNGASLANIKVLTQFNLRFLSRKWAALVYGQFKTVGLSYQAGGICIFEDCGDYQHVALGNPPWRSLDSTSDELTDQTVAGIAKHSLASLITKLMIRIENEAAGDESLSDVLTKLTSVFRQTCSLNLTFAVTVNSRIDDLAIPFSEHFPQIELRSLCVELCNIPVRAIGNAQPPRHVITACDSLKFLLAAGVKTLVELAVNVFLLKRVFCDGDQALPATWSCGSLRKLHLEFAPFDDNYDYRNELSFAEIVSFQGMLPRIFPRLQELYFYGKRPHMLQIDFAPLAHLPGLAKLWLRADLIQTKGHVTPLPGIRELLLKYPLPFEISAVPNLEKFEIMASRDNVFQEFTAEIAAGAPGGLVLQHVSELTLSASNRWRPSYDDLIRLLQALQGLPQLTTLTISTSRKLRPWTRAGGLALLETLPAGLSSLCVEFVLVPNDCICEIGVTPGASWTLDAEEQHAELIFKTWLRNLLHRISGMPTLAKFRCVCVGPSFEVIVGLAAKWNRSAAFAIADLGLRCVLHVQCSENYQRMRCQGEPLREGDQMHFRFVVSPQAQFDPHSLKPLSVAANLKQKIVNVVFENPNGSN